MEEYVRKAKFASLKEFDPFSGANDFMEVTEWYNGEGFDLVIGARTESKHYSFTWGEFECLKAMIGED